jgi:hypothetical protein
MDGATTSRGAVKVQRSTRRMDLAFMSLRPRIYIPQKRGFEPLSITKKHLRQIHADLFRL